MDTFGQTGTGSSHSSSSGAAYLLNTSAESNSSPASNGTLQSITFNYFLSATATVDVIPVIYDSSGNLLATGDQSVLSATTATQATLTFSGANQISLVAGTPYTYGVIWNKPTNSASIEWSRQSAISTSWKGGISTYPIPPSTVSSAGGTVSGPVDMYVTYTPSGTTTNSGFLMFM